MKALSLWQPWASLAIHGLKQYETRGWACPPWLLGKPVALHATKTLMREAREVVEDDRSESFAEAFRSIGATLDTLPLGAVLGVVRVMECLRTEDALRSHRVREFEREYEFGNFGPGRFAWRVEVMERFEEPIPAKGMQGLWEWDRAAAKAGAA